jgi:hypothetical protein
MPHHLSSMKSNSENFRKMYYKPLRVINGEFSQKSRHATPPFSIEKQFRKIYFCKLVPQLQM